MHSYPTKTSGNLRNGTERDRVLHLYRKARIGEDTVERQMQEIAREEAILGEQISELGLRLEGVGTETVQVAAARTALEKLSARLEQPASWELRRQLMVTLVEQVRVDTRHEGGERRAVITVTYRFCADPILRAPARGRRIGISPENPAPKLESVLPRRANQEVKRQPAALGATA